MRLAILPLALMLSSPLALQSTCEGCAPEEDCPTPTVEEATPTTSASPDPTASGLPACLGTYPAGTWDLSGTTRWEIPADDLAWVVSTVVIGDVACAPFEVGWQEVEVLRLSSGESLGVASAQVSAEPADAPEASLCAGCSSAVWRVYATPGGGTNSDPDDVRRLLPAGWVNAWLDHRESIGREPVAPGDPVTIWWDVLALEGGDPSWSVGYQGDQR